MLDEAFDAKSWHGTNLRGSVRGLSAAEAAHRPGRGRHNIAEIVVHAAYWKYAVRRRLSGGRRGSFAVKGSNWFARPDVPSEAAWREDVKLLLDEHRLLREAVARLSDADLRRRAPGKTYDVGHLLRGVAAHDLYHAGQIQLLKRFARGGRA